MAPKKGRAKGKRGINSSQISNENAIHPDIQSYITDFETQVGKRIEAIRSEGKLFAKEIENLHRMVFLKVPKNVREMKFDDFLACESDFDLDRKVEEDVAAAVFKVPASKKKPPTSKRSSRQGATTAKKVGSRASKTVAQTPVNAPSTSLRSNLTITPACDPRVAMTPLNSCRAAKMGEVTFSTRGSPVVQKRVGDQSKPPADGFIATLTKKGEILQVTDSPLGADNVPQLKPDVKKDIVRLKNKLSLMLKQDAVFTMDDS